MANDAGPKDLHTLVPYMRIITSFVDGVIGADQFERSYLTLYKTDPTPWSPDVFNVLDGLFAEVDDYTPHPELRGAGDPDADDLRRQAAGRLEQLRALRGDVTHS